MKVVTKIIICLLLVSCGSDPVEITKEYDWKDCSMEGVSVLWNDIQMIDDKVGYLAGVPTLISQSDTNAITNEMIYADTLNYNLEQGYITEPKTPGAFLYRTDNGGVSWGEVHVPFKTGIQQIKFFNSDFGFVSTTAEGVYKTVDKGKTWIRLLSGIIAGQSSMFGGIYNLYFRDESKGYAVLQGSRPFILKTNNGGDTWQEVGIFDGSLVYCDTETMYVSTGRKLFKSVDDAETWIELPIEFEEGFDALCFVSSDNFFVALKNEILETYDGGLTWTSYPTGINFTSQLFVKNRTAFIWDMSNLYKIDLENDGEPSVMTLERDDALLDLEFISDKAFAVGRNGMLLSYDDIE